MTQLTEKQDNVRKVYRPCGDRVIIEREVEEERGGIVIPKTATEREVAIGVVLAVGPGSYASKTGTFIPNTIEVGMRVAYSRYGASQVTIDGTKYDSIREDLIMGELC